MDCVKKVEGVCLTNISRPGWSGCKLGTDICIVCKHVCNLCFSIHHAQYMQHGDAVLLFTYMLLSRFAPVFTTSFSA